MHLKEISYCGNCIKNMSIYGTLENFEAYYIHNFFMFYLFIIFIHFFPFIYILIKGYYFEVLFMVGFLVEYCAAVAVTIGNIGQVFILKSLYIRME